MAKKVRISKEASIKQILQLLRRGYATTEITQDITSNYDIHEATVYSHLKEAREIYHEELKEQQQKIQEVRLEQSERIARRGLKSKFERDLEIQSEIDYYKKIISGEEKVSFILGRKVSQTEKLPIDVVLKIQETIDRLRRDLAKRLGEYEAQKHQVETTVSGAESIIKDIADKLK